MEFATTQVVTVPVIQTAGVADIGSTPDRDPTYVVPASYAFAIGSLIVALTGAYIDVDGWRAHRAAGHPAASAARFTVVRRSAESGHPGEIDDLDRAAAWFGNDAPRRT